MEVANQFIWALERISDESGLCNENPAHILTAMNRCPVRYCNCSSVGKYIALQFLLYLSARTVCHWPEQILGENQLILKHLIWNVGFELLIARIVSHLISSFPLRDHK